MDKQTFLENKKYKTFTNKKANNILIKKIHLSDEDKQKLEKSLKLLSYEISNKLKIEEQLSLRLALWVFVKAYYELSYIFWR